MNPMACEQCTTRDDCIQSHACIRERGRWDVSEAVWFAKQAGELAQLADELTERMALVVAEREELLTRLVTLEAVAMAARALLDPAQTSPLSSDEFCTTCIGCGGGDTHSYFNENDFPHDEDCLWAALTEALAALDGKGH